MKKIIVLAILVLNVLVFALPTLAAPNENAAARAFLAQDINDCRRHMQEMVESGEMTRQQLNQCIENMKSGKCMHHEEADKCTCAHSI